MNRGLEPWIEKWWGIANARRFRLINKKEKAKLSTQEAQEYKLLDAVADAIVKYVSAKNPYKELKVFCQRCKEPIELRDLGRFPTHACPAQRKKR